MPEALASADSPAGVLPIFRETRAMAWQGLRFALPAMGLALFAVTCALFVPTSDVIRILRARTLFGVSLWMTKLIQRSDLTEALTIIRSFLKRN
jgi:hypothetical protein